MPRTQEQASLLMALLREMGIPYGTRGETVPEEDRFYPELERKLERTRKDYREGKTTRLSAANGYEDFWTQVRSS